MEKRARARDGAQTLFFAEQGRSVQSIPEIRVRRLSSVVRRREGWRWAAGSGSRGRAQWCQFVTAFFTVTNATLLRSLPVADADRVLELYTVDRATPGSAGP